jgi:hypothetical protein
MSQEGVGLHLQDKAAKRMMGKGIGLIDLWAQVQPQQQQQTADGVQGQAPSITSGF